MAISRERLGMLVRTALLRLAPVQAVAVERGGRARGRQIEHTEKEAHRRSRLCTIHNFAWQRFRGRINHGMI